MRKMQNKKLSDPPPLETPQQAPMEGVTSRPAAGAGAPGASNALPASAGPTGGGVKKKKGKKKK